MAKKNKVMSVRVNSEKLKILKETGVTFADFVRRSLDVYEEQWRLKKYKNSKQLGKALVTILKIETLEAEREIIEKKLNEIMDYLKELWKPIKPSAPLSEYPVRARKRKFYNHLREQFVEMREKNEMEMKEYQEEYLKSLSLEQIKKRCSAIHI